MYGLDAFTASLPKADHGWDAKPGAGVVDAPTKGAGLIPDEAESPFAGKGELLEADDVKVFKTIDALVRRQEPIAKNRLAVDRHFTAVKSGYQFSSLTKQDNQDVYTQSYPPGMSLGLRVGAVPNKQADLCNKLVETLLVDPPKLDPEATVDDESAQRGADLAREFLTQDATEAGMDDITLFAYQLDAGTSRGSVYNHYWVDPTGGGAIPKQVKAHPLATDPATPLDAVDPMTGLPLPTTDYVLRYVTEDGQFTEHPAEAERVWLPKIRADKLGREHVRLFPETADLHDAQRVIVLWYATVEECQRRWPEYFEGLTDADITALCAWVPARPRVLLPSALRNRWSQERATPDGSGAWTADERLVFFYCYYHKSDKSYPEGAMICVNGGNGGTVLGRDVLSATVEVPTGKQQDQTVTETKPLDLPLAQIRLLPDTADGDPTGLPFMSRIAGPGEAGAVMATAMMEAIDVTLHPARYATATSPVNADDVESSRATGDFVTVVSKDDFPQYEEARDLPGAFFNYIGWLYDGMDSSAGLRPPDKATEQKVKSGVALRIEVQEANKALSRMAHAVHTAWSRHGRIKLQLAMKYFSVPQLLRYVGTDGVAKQEWFSGNDFAQVGNVTIATGSGTMLPPTERVNYLSQLQALGQVDADEAMESARPAFAKTLGIPENPHRQRYERQESAWLEGPPEGWEAEQAQFTQLAMQHAVESQAALQADPLAQIAPEPPAPWTPFAMEPVDAEPAVAAMRRRMLGRLQSKVEYAVMPEPWKQLVRDAYAQAAGAAQPAPVVAPAPTDAPKTTDPNAVAGERQTGLEGLQA